jgi:hypothetical protein
MTRPAAEAAVGRLQDAVGRLAERTRGRALTGLCHQDADDVTGTADTDDAIGFDPFPLLRALDACGVRIVVMGQAAAIMNGSRELTGDLDLLWDGDPGQADALAEAFNSVSADLADNDGVPIRCEPAAFSLPKVLFRTATASGDCCTPNLPWGDLPMTDFIARCQVATAPGGFNIRYLTCADVIRMQRWGGRPKDLRRADELDHLTHTDRKAGGSSPSDALSTQSRPGH